MQGLIFDFDGLILETEVPVYQAWQELFHEHGAELPLSLWVTTIGTSHGKFNAYAALEAHIGRPIDCEAVRKRVRQRAFQLLEGHPPMSGVVDYISKAKQLGLKLGVASSSSRDWVTAHLSRLELIHQFGVIKCGDDVKQTKPDPELYLATVRDLGLQPSQAIALEDSPNGVLAAKRAGLFCVAVPSPLTKDLPLDHADLRLDSLADMPLEDLLKLPLSF